MARAAPDKSIPPPLRALGGWLDAGWFDAAIMEEGEVVGFSFPPLAGLRKQTFELAERSARSAAPKKRGARKADPVPDRVPSGIVALLDSLGVVRAASFRRPRFFFGAAPTLFFGIVPAANLKVKAADSWRRNLISNAFRGCVLRCDAAEITVMAWPAHEADITAFVLAAAPDHEMHAQFEQAEEARRLAEPPRRRGFGGAQAEAGSSKGNGGSSGRAEDRAERERLLAELDGMRARIAELQRLHSVEGALETLGLTDARLKAMLLLLHPDKHGNSEAANEAAKWVNGLRDVLKAGAGRK